MQNKIKYLLLKRTVLHAVLFLIDIVNQLMYKWSRCCLKYYITAIIYRNANKLFIPLKGKKDIVLIVSDRVNKLLFREV